MTQAITEHPGATRRSVPATLLQRFARVRSGDVSEFITELNACYGPAAVEPRHGSWHGKGHELRALTGPGFTIGYVRSGMGVHISQGEGDGSCFLNMALSGTVRSQSGDEQLLNRPGMAAVLSARQVHALQPEDTAAETAGIRLDGDLVDAELAALLGRPPSTPVRFRMGLDLTTVAGQGIGALAWALLIEASRPTGGLFDRPEIQLQYVRTLTIALLMSQGHNYSEALRDAQAPLRPRSLRRALEYIESHLASVITVADIAVAAGCGVRTLHGYFHEYVGTGPMGYVRELRLQRVRADLRRTGRPVTEVAYAWGFTHLGRFSAAYQQRFGELPSQTARGT